MAKSSKRKRASLPPSSSLAPPPAASSSTSELAAAKAAALLSLEASPAPSSTPSAKRTRFYDDGQVVDVKHANGNGVDKGKEASVIVEERERRAQGNGESTIEGQVGSGSGLNGILKKKEVVQEEELRLDNGEPLPPTAFTDAFGAMLNEYQHHHSHTPSATLPTSASSKRASSILYYALPLSLPAKPRKPPPPRVAQPHSNAPTQLSNSHSSSKKPAEKFKEVKKTIQCGSSDMDEDEFAEMFGVYPVHSEESVPATLASDVVEQDEEEQPMDVAPSPSPAPAPAVNPAQVLPPPPTTQTLPTAAPTRQTQATLLQNALSAQYWAGYHTALLHQSMGYCPAGAKTVEPVIEEGAEWERGRHAAQS